LAPWNLTSSISGFCRAFWKYLDSSPWSEYGMSPEARKGQSARANRVTFHCQQVSVRPLPWRGRITNRHCEERSDETIYASSFRGDAKHRTRNLEIPGLVLRTIPE
jgi:hypothetical protein